MTRCVLLLSVLAAGLTSCGKPPDEMRAYLLAEGDWGWANGTGCADRAHVWSNEGNRMTRYREGEVVEVAINLERTPLYDNGRSSGEGALSSVRWSFSAAAPDESRQFGRQTIWFSIRGGPFRPTALVPRNHRQFTALASQEDRRIEEPHRGDRLVHCSDWAG